MTVCARRDCGLDPRSGGKTTIKDVKETDGHASLQTVREEYCVIKFPNFDLCITMVSL